MIKILKNKTNLILLLILVVSFVLRVYKIGSVPPSLNWDEVSHGYNAFSILKTGNDEWGIKFPLIFRAYGDFKLPLYIYLTVLSEIIFGLSSFSVRFISVVSGVGLVLLSYLITKVVTKNEKYSLTSAILMAVTPWGLFLSRIAVEANLGAFLFALGVYFLLLWLEKTNFKFLLISFFSWGFSLHSYNSARIMVPVFVLLTIFLVIIKKKAIQIILPLIILIVFSLPVISQFINQSGNARFENVSLIDQGTVNRIIEMRNNSKLFSPLPRLFYNRPSFFVFYSFKNYLLNLSPNYLFFIGGSQYQFSFPGHELLFLVTAPFLLIGIIFALFGKRKAKELIVVFWFFSAIIPSAITKDAPHVLRTIFIFPVPIILSILGLQYLSDFLAEHKSKMKGNLLIGVFLFSVVFSFGKWWIDYLNIYPKAYSWAWQYGYKEAVGFVKEKYDDYEKIFITKRLGEPHEFILFYFPWDPKTYQTDNNKKWDYHSNWYWIDGFDKFVFLNDWEVVDKVSELQSFKDSQKKFLLITSSGNYPQGWNKIKTVEFLDSRPALEILEKKF